MNKVLSPKVARPRTKSHLLQETTNYDGKLRLNKNGFSLFFGKSVKMVLK